MQINIYLKWALLILNIALFANAHGQEEQKNKLVEFKGFGQWEVWCIDVQQSGNVECNFNHVLRYKDHPDFRAMIFRFYSDGEQVTRMAIDQEWQTSFSRGFLQIDDFEKVDLAVCSEKCELQREQLNNVVDQLNLGNKAMIRFHDYFVQEFQENIPLAGFAEGLQSLIEMQKRFN